MLDILGELLGGFFWHYLLQGTGHVLAMVFTLGRVKCSDDAATVIGVSFWLLFILAAVIVFSVR